MTSEIQAVGRRTTCAHLKLITGWLCNQDSQEDIHRGKPKPDGFYLLQHPPNSSTPIQGDASLATHFTGEDRMAVR